MSTRANSTVYNASPHRPTNTESFPAGLIWVSGAVSTIFGIRKNWHMRVT